MPVRQPEADADCTERHNPDEMNPRQTRLSLVMGVVAALGSAAILWVWWDSTEYFRLWVSREWLVVTAESALDIRLGNTSDFLDLGYTRIGRELLEVDEPTMTELFPGMRISAGDLRLPMWFILCAFLSVLLLLWLVLMKRLARPRITEG